MNADPLADILSLARWAPSGDNTQPWRFERRGPLEVAVHCRDTRDHVVYDLRGHASQVSYGALLETMAIAATAHQLRPVVKRGGSEQEPVFEVRFDADPALARSPLIDVIEQRSVQRRPLSRQPLLPEHRQALEAALGPGYTLQWLEGPARAAAARLMYRNARVRLTMPEAFTVHRDIIDWDNLRSKDKVPAGALGVDAITVKLMRWGMHSWERMRRMNALMGTWAPRLQMDLLPGLACAAHYVLRAAQPPQGIDDYVDAGRAVQRLWLTLTSLGLMMQPELTPLIFSAYLRDGVRFTTDIAVVAEAEALRHDLRQLLGGEVERAVYMGRVGYGTASESRSIRRDLQDLMR
ncbi:molybdopterin biosynthesis protein MoeY [Duganella sp. FT50W]|uniref:Molybdopterin biosynthesis protein MoeY n=1 Tax=Duganella lactea TaxID=2692173 RepID=A0A6L8MEN0_9BURK|nr:molybdopterin biosynthesis protein MoeY [Duganella lactea]MYM80894.1 molybdopterin biosynthesis protein MoeY [Duganella lactea]